MFDSFQEFWSWGDGIFASLCIALLVTAAFWLVSSFLYRRVGPGLVARLDEEKHPILIQLLRGFHHPVSALLKVAGICVGLLILSRQLENEVLPQTIKHLLGVLPPMVERTLRIAIVVAVAWGLVVSSDISALLLRNARHRLDLHMSKSVSRFLTAVSNVVVIGIAGVILLAEFDININGLIAGLGLGGLTIALAAKDSASNFFGGLVLVIEKPFEIGDWIVCENVEGAVEDINLRSTKIRTASGALTIMPNATLAAAPITNWGGGMEKRRADFILSLEYGSPKKQLREFTAEAQTMLETDPDIIPASIVVRLTDFAESSLGVRVIFDTSMPGFADHLRVRERVNYNLLDIANRLGLSFAFPSRSVYLAAEHAPDKPAPEKQP